MGMNNIKLLIVSDLGDFRSKRQRIEWRLKKRILLHLRLVVKKIP